jgi:hypothetical protein
MAIGRSGFLLLSGEGGPKGRMRETFDGACRIRAALLWERLLAAKLLLFALVFDGDQHHARCACAVALRRQKLSRFARVVPAGQKQERSCF